MLVYDVTNPKSLKTIPVWFEICRQVDWHGKNGAPVASVLLGNRNDLEHRRAVQEDEGLNMAERYLMKHFISSAKNNQGLEDPFRYLANSYYQHRINEEKEDI
uniref:Ras-related protein Rab-10 n=1 Tax=Lygus hesperus TaxID=30085 RepID=A0A146MDN3_LYGHE